jgi:hypothetical protein
MTARQRRCHRLLWLVLTPLLAALMVLALLRRPAPAPPQAPIHQPPPPTPQTPHDPSTLRAMR